MTGRLTVAWLIPVLILLSGCSGMRITTDFDQTYNFSNLRTYAWMEGKRSRPTDPSVDTSLLETRVKNAVDAELAMKGYEAVPADQADFHVGYHAAVRSKIDAYTMSNFYGYRPGWGAGYSDVHVYEYDEGSLVLDIVDPDTNNLLWRGGAQAEVGDWDTPEKREARIREAVARILSRFPPQ